MDEGAKRRLVGAAVLVALVVIFVPMLLDRQQEPDVGEPIAIPESPDFNASYDDNVMPPVGALDEELVIPPLPAAESPEEFIGTESGPPLDDEQSMPAPARQPAAASVAAPAPAPAPGPSKPPARVPTTTGPKPVPQGVAAWVVQVASLGSPGAAQKLQDDLRGRGYPAFVEQARVNGKTYYRVRVGPETERGRADAIADRLKDANGNRPPIYSYR